MKRILLFMGAMFLLSSCTDELDQMINDFRSGAHGAKVVFQASTEGPAAPETKVYADENMKVLWNEGDQITIFNKITYNHGFEFDGEDGDTAGGFSQFTEISSFSTWADLPYVYAVYPYDSKTKINNSGVMTVTLPSEQAYKEKSFGIGANTMAAVSENYFLGFKNVGGYLSLRLYGDDISVSRITIQGNNGEKIAGKAKIEIPLGGIPTVTMDNTATESISIVCDPAVKIGEDADNYTAFWFVIPPVTFEKGFTITVTDEKGGVFEKSTSKSFSVTRNTLDWMNALKVVPNYDNVIIQFADANFKAYCLENFDTNKDGEISGAEAELVTDITVCTDNIKSLGGIEYFTNLKTLSCTGSLIGTKSTTGAYAGQLETINIGQNILLEELDCHGNQLDSLDVSNNPNLNTVICTDNPIEVINLAPGQVIATLEAPEDSGIVYDWEDVIGPMSFPDAHFRAYVFSNIDTDGDGILSEAECDAVISIYVCTDTIASVQGIALFANLNQLYCIGDTMTNGVGSGRLASLDVSHNKKLGVLNCTNNQLTNLDVTANTNLWSLICSVNQLTSLDISNNTALTSLMCELNSISSLNVNSNTALTRILCNGNQLTSLDVSNNAALTQLVCNNNQLSNLVLNENTSLSVLRCFNNRLTSLDVSNTALSELWCDGNSLLTEIWLKAGQSIESLVYDTDIATIKYKDASGSEIIRFEDAHFKAYCVDNFDTNGDGEISFLETKGVTRIVVCTDSILSLQGIEYFNNLTYLDCQGSKDTNTGDALGQLTSLDLSHNAALQYLNCCNNPCSSIDVSNTALTELHVSSQEGTLGCSTSLNLSGCTALEVLDCSYIHNELDLSDFSALKVCRIEYSSISSIDLSNKTGLTELSTIMCGSLTSLDVSNCTSLKSLWCDGNSLTSLDVSTCTSLESLSCEQSKLTSLDVSHNSALAYLDCLSNASLTVIWLKSGQTIAELYKPDTTTIEYK